MLHDSLMTHGVWDVPCRAWCVPSTDQHSLMNSRGPCNKAQLHPRLSNTMVGQADTTGGLSGHCCTHRSYIRPHQHQVSTDAQLMHKPIIYPSSATVAPWRPHQPPQPCCCSQPLPCWPLPLPPSPAAHLLPSQPRPAAPWLHQPHAAAAAVGPQPALAVCPA